VTRMVTMQRAGRKNLWRT